MIWHPPNVSTPANACEGPEVDITTCGEGLPTHSERTKMLPKHLRGIATLTLASLHSAVAKQRTAPPPGALAVRAGATPASGMFETINGALAALPNDDSSRTIFIFPGVYNELVNITRTGPLTVRPSDPSHRYAGEDTLTH